MHPDLRNHTGWFCVYDDGTEIIEEKKNWQDVDVARIVLLGVVRNGVVYQLPPGKRNYFQTKSASAIIGQSEVRIESRNIGFIDGKIEFKMKVVESTGDCVMDTRKI